MTDEQRAAANLPPDNLDPEGEHAPSAAARPSRDDWQAWIIRPQSEPTEPPPAPIRKTDEALALAADIERETFKQEEQRFSPPAWTLPGRAGALLAEMTDAIAAHPDAPINYVLRGELFLKHGEYELAHADFVKGVALAAAQMAQADWGLTEQAVQDRAERGLRRLKRYLR